MSIKRYTEHPFKMCRVGGKLICMGAALLTMSMASTAQQQSEDESVAQTAPMLSQPAVGSPEVLRLEQTIRANKEQPQVLTIVPWQLPSHQRINETQTWQPVVQKLPSIERSQFLRDLSVVDGILLDSTSISKKND
ncbi:hypothetical protein [Glaciecola sp. SC05]|uniref:hypothetical protein n=1 Tax=Glaciecola sp. SC05 TaxID=1987355 RepID=UPI003527EAA7